MNRQSSSKTNTRSRSIDEDGIRLSFSEADAQSEMTDEGNIERLLWIGCRTEYGRGLVRIFAWFDPEKQRVIWEERDRERSTFITLTTTADEVERLVPLLTMAQKHLPLERSA